MRQSHLTSPTEYFTVERSGPALPSLAPKAFVVWHKHLAVFVITRAWKIADEFMTENGLTNATEIAAAKSGEIREGFLEIGYSEWAQNPTDCLWN